MKKRYAVLMMLILIPASIHAEIYKWKGANGRITYSDVPPSDGASHEALRTKNKAQTPNAMATPNETPKPTEAAQLNAAKADPAKVKDMPESSEQRARRKQACDVAKENLQKLNAGGSIYRQNDKGERQYLDETSIKAEMAEAQKQIDTACKE